MMKSSKALAYNPVPGAGNSLCASVPRSKAAHARAPEEPRCPSRLQSAARFSSRFALVVSFLPCPVTSLGFAEKPELPASATPGENRGAGSRSMVFLAPKSDRPGRFPILRAMVVSRHGCAYPANHGNSRAEELDVPHGRGFNVQSKADNVCLTPDQGPT